MINQEKFPWVVQKLSGSTIRNHLNDIADFVVPTYLQTNQVAIVCCSTITHRLAKMTLGNFFQGSAQCLDIIEQIQKSQLDTARASIQNKDVLSRLEIKVVNECLKLTRLLKAAQIINEMSEKSKDKVMRIGEKLASITVSAVLEDRNIENQVCNLDTFCVLDYSSQVTRLRRTVLGCGNRIPILPDFSCRGIHVCASLTAVGLKAQELQLWKNIDGLYTADPNIVKSARLLSIISPEEVAEMSEQVMHPYMVEQVVQSNIPIRIKNAASPLSPGTLILPEKQQKRNLGYVTPPYTNDANYDEYPTAISVKRHLNVIRVHSNKKLRSHEFLARLFGTLDLNHIPVDLNSTSETHVCLTVPSEYSLSKQVLSDLGQLGKVKLVKEVALISLIGKQMKKSLIIAGNLFTSLAEAGIPVDMISQSISGTNISCAVQDIYAVRVLKIIHEKLLDVDPNLFALCVQQQTL